MIGFLVIGAAVVIALLALNFWLDRFIMRAMFKLVDRLPPYRWGGRYRLQPMPEKYALLRKPRDGRYPPGHAVHGLPSRPDRPKADGLLSGGKADWREAPKSRQKLGFCLVLRYRDQGGRK